MLIPKKVIVSITPESSFDFVKKNVGLRLESYFMDKEIDSLSQLINQLQGSSKEEYKSIGASLKIPLAEFLPYTHWSKEHYTRNCIIRENDFELILLCWEPGQKTPIHCHGGEECWVYMVDGNVQECHYDFKGDVLGRKDKIVLNPGEKSFMSDDLGYHCLENNNDERAISLHLYMDPIDNCTIYNDDSKEFEPRSLSYYSYKGILEEVEV